MESFRVEVTSLNLRTKPKVAPSTKLAILHYGQIVQKVAQSDITDWWEVSTTVDKKPLTGFVNSRYLQAENQFVQTASTNTVSEVHLSTTKNVSRHSGGRAFPLNEANQPTRNATHANQLHQIVNWLEVETSNRYRPNGSTTYCNIYVYDFCYLANVYIPRVWWTSQALLQLSRGHHVTPKYDQTVQELNANSLFNWLSGHGSNFGWQRSFDLDEVQQQANQGAVCLISARRKDRNQPGHICMVVPETDDFKAKRSNGVVSVPVQSQAGSSNFRYGGKVWWTSEKFDGFSFWIHA